MATSLKEAYDRRGKSDAFMCRYFNLPDNIEGAKAKFTEKKEEHILLIDHNLVELRKEFPWAKYCTLLRSPVRRMISTFYWLERFHPETMRGRDIRTWMEQSGPRYSLCFQFARFEGGGEKMNKQLSQLSTAEIKQMGENWFDENICFFGITEYFEESAIFFAHNLGLPELAPWRPDKRNSKRPKWDQIDPSLLSEIEEIMRYDIDFYEKRKRSFENVVQSLKDVPEFMAYKQACQKSNTAQQSYGASEISKIIVDIRAKLRSVKK